MKIEELQASLEAHEIRLVDRIRERNKVQICLFSLHFHHILPLIPALFMFGIDPCTL